MSTSIDVQAFLSDNSAVAKSVFELVNGVHERSVSLSSALESIDTIIRDLDARSEVVSLAPLRGLCEAARFVLQKQLS